MLSKIPKTGLAKKMRKTMAAWEGKFTALQIYEEMGIPSGKERDIVRRAMSDFVKRGEIVKVIDRRRKRRASLYYYIMPKSLGARNDEDRQRIYKAMRLINFKEPFAISDIQRMTGMKDRSYIDKLTRKLLKEGRLIKIGYRPRSCSCGREALYMGADSDRFRLEVIK